MQNMMNLNQIEAAVNGRMLTPIRLPLSQQVQFRSVQQVRDFAKGTGDLPPNLMMTRMLEAFFAHYSTSTLISNTKGLTTMFSNLFKGWVNALMELGWNRNQYATYAEYEAAIYAKQAELDNAFEAARDDMGRSRVKMSRMAFDATHRSQAQIERLLTEFTFKVASRYYYIDPSILQKKKRAQYLHLRESVLDAWEDSVGVEALKTTRPWRLFQSLDPKTVAISVFPLDKEFYVDQLESKYDHFVAWHRKAMREAVESAQETNVQAYVQSVRKEWKDAVLYAKTLRDALMKRAKQLEDGSDMEDFIVDSDDDDGDAIGNANDQLDKDNMFDEVQRIASRFNNITTYNESMTEEEIEEFLRQEDRRVTARERKVGAFLEKAVEDNNNIEE